MRAITNSERNTISCWQRWMWQYGLRLRPTVDEKHFLRGNLWHEAMDTYHTDGLEAARKALDAAIDSERAGSGLLVVGSDYDTTDKELDMFAKVMHPLLGFYDANYRGKWETLHIEIELDADVGAFEYKGKVDKIVKDLETGKHYIVDHKTTRQPLDRWHRFNEHSPQLVSYAMLAEEALGLDIAGYIYDAVLVPDEARADVFDRVTKSGKLYKHTPDRLPNCTPQAWLNAMDQTGDHTKENRDVLVALFAREKSDFEMQRFKVDLTRKDIERVKKELTQVANLINSFDNVIKPYREKLWAAYNGDGDFQQVLREINREASPMFPRNHQECFKYGQTCPYYQLCHNGELRHDDEFRMHKHTHTEYENE